jgi:hypothetical protein
MCNWIFLQLRSLNYIYRLMSGIVRLEFYIKSILIIHVWPYHICKNLTGQSWADVTFFKEMYY